MGSGWASSGERYRLLRDRQLRLGQTSGLRDRLPALFDVVDDLPVALVDLEPIVFAEGLHQAHLRRDQRPDDLAGDEGDFIDGGQGRGVGRGHVEPLVFEPDRHDLVLQGEVPGDEGDDFRREVLQLFRVDVRGRQLAAEEKGEVLFLDKAELDEVGADAAAEVDPVLQGFVAVGGGDQIGFEKHVQQGDRHVAFPCEKVSVALLQVGSYPMRRCRKLSRSGHCR
jgi:hypothetical protein